MKKGDKVKANTTPHYIVDGKLHKSWSKGTEHVVKEVDDDKCLFVIEGDQKCWHLQSEWDIVFDFGQFTITDSNRIMIKIGEDKYFYLSPEGFDDLQNALNQAKFNIGEDSD